MKSDTTSVSGKNLNHLNPAYADSFAGYIAGFVKAHQAEGINFSAVSPSNEPENVFVDWPSCFWTPRSLSGFVRDNLRPALNAAGLNTLITAPENAGWGTTELYLYGIDAAGEMGAIDVLIGHGYWDPVEAAIAALTHAPTYNQNINGWVTGTDGKPVWMTEISNANGIYDASMKEGIAFATSIHKFMTRANVNAFVFWLAMLAIRNNEAIICTGPDGKLVYPKTYDVYGQYTRYVRPGYVRINAVSAGADSLYVSAYKDPGTSDFSIILTNGYAARTITTSISAVNFNGGIVTPYYTNSSVTGDNHWVEGDPVSSVNGNYQITLPPRTVMTLTGRSVQ